MDIPDEVVDNFEFLIVSNTAGGAFYGTLVIIEIIVIFMIFSKERFIISRPRMVFLTLCLTMFMTSSAYFAINLARCLTSLRSWKSTIRQNPHMLAHSEQLYSRLQIVEDAIYPINFFFSDAVVVWRAWFLVHKRARLVLSVLLVGTAASVILLMRQDALPLSLQNNIPYNIAVLVPLVLTNISATWMIGHKFWSTRRFLRPHILRESDRELSFHRNSLARARTEIERILLIILESGFLYLVVWVFSIVAVSGAFGDTATDLKDAFLPHLAAIYPPVVFLLVASQKSQVNAVLRHEDAREPTEIVSMQTMEFTSIPAVTTAEEDLSNRIVV
ncbi:hypothetical protein K435DRAFT_782572 [Dendrothele bispora CBS 962.96]|uniref:Uncharacterized protein n=1 Tax=Dendrothele bispora (strain CBS 962.96) TaxID=1314807 RepID=A0A4V4HDG8_DENBC|nr:hypothetical protein K435DRAFT_782572 [Dendrothele bispora CBS 962.96]